MEIGDFYGSGRAGDPRESTCRMIPDCAPSGANGPGYVGLGIVADHHVVVRIVVAGLRHGVVKQTAVGLVDSDVVAEHHDVDPRFESGRADLAELHLFETVA